MRTMEIMEKANWIFRDEETGDAHPVHMQLNTNELKKGDWYLDNTDGCVYECIGEISSINDISQGKIFNINEHWNIEPYVDDDLKYRFSEVHILTEEEYNKKMNNVNDFDSLLSDYIDEYESGNNRMLQISTTLTSSGEVFLPELRPDDDPFEKVIKSMLLHLKVVLNDYKQNAEKPHIIDNLRSALSGATKNMSVTKFLLWCKVLEFDWEITLVNANDMEPNPLRHDIVVSNTNDAWMDIAPSEDKNIFVVPLAKEEDPLKRAIKLALYQKQIDTKNCEDRCSSPHLINNMKSALKNKQKMTMLYFMSWCELLDVMFKIKVTDPKSGDWYQVVGYDLYTNVEEDKGGEVND